MSMDTRTGRRASRRRRQRDVARRLRARAHLREYGMLLSLLVDHGVLPVHDRRHAAAAAQHHQPGPAEQLHRHHGAGHAAGHRGRPHRPVGRLGRRLRRRARGDADGAATSIALRPGRRSSAWSSAASIGAAQGYWVAYLQDPVLHRDAGRHAGLQGPDLALLRRPVGRAVPGDFQRSARASFPTCSAATALRTAPRCCSASSSRVGAASISACAHARKPGSSTAIETEPFALLRRQERSSSRRSSSSFSYLLATYKGLPNVLIIMALLIALYAFVTNRTTIGRRIYALGGNEKAAQAVRHQDRAADLPDLRQHGRAGRRSPA